MAIKLPTCFFYVLVLQLRITFPYFRPSPVARFPEVTL